MRIFSKTLLEFNAVQAEFVNVLIGIINMPEVVPGTVTISRKEVATPDILIYLQFNVPDRRDGVRDELMQALFDTALASELGNQLSARTSGTYNFDNTPEIVAQTQTAAPSPSVTPSVSQTNTATASLGSGYTFSSSSSPQPTPTATPTASMSTGASPSVTASSSTGSANEAVVGKKKSAGTFSGTILIAIIAGGVVVLVTAVGGFFYYRSRRGETVPACLPCSAEWGVTC